MEIKLPVKTAVQIRKDLIRSIESRVEAYQSIKEKFPDIAEALISVRRQQQEMLDELNRALGLDQEVKVGDQVILIEALGIYGRYSRKGILREKLDPARLPEIDGPDCWEVYFPEDAVGDGDLSCRVPRSKFMLDPA